jgi:adenylate cyclase
LTEQDRLLLRIGLHQGDVVVQDGDLLGDGVNVAARLEPLAEPGGIALTLIPNIALAGGIAGRGCWAPIG